MIKMGKKKFNPSKRSEIQTAIDQIFQSGLPSRLYFHFLRETGGVIYAKGFLNIALDPKEDAQIEFLIFYDKKTQQFRVVEKV